MHKFASRWCVKGMTPAYGPCTTVFDLLVDLETIAVYPGATDAHAVLLNADKITRLNDHLSDDIAVEVNGLSVGSTQPRLGLRPVQLPTAPRGPIELYAKRPLSSIQVIYHKNSLVALRETIAELARVLAPIC
ncbi:hypothetical protein [Alloactinosynnema sp. L-07]|uniref:hypothetical protein n=1 Tax=Alloactinosynnema sp. L-07 TaxID=1653480 RepID=UPI00065EF48D|nr:hypothetical protein [Alloactinosynnema sp. L-07]CRK61787.1 hypothetical protein [Alloactinosynnema sp. L-07]